MMEEKGIGGLGTSLKVPNVQALAASTNGLGEVPPRYIRPDMEADGVVHDDNGDDIPVIDMSRLLDPHCSKEESLKLDIACQEWGFFQLVNHGVTGDIIQRMASDLDGFFKLPLKEKEAFAQLPGGIQGYGQAFVKSEEQKLDWADMMFLDTQPVSVRNMHFWPKNPPTFRDTLDEYSLQLKDLAANLLRIMAKNLGIDQETIIERFKEQHQGLRINYYPPCPEANKVVGLSSHTDTVGLALVLEANGVPGLQIRKDSKWLPIKTIPGALIANIGDILEIMSNGKYKSIEHRAIINPEKERISVAAFHFASNEALIGPLPELLAIEGDDEKYKAMTYGNYMKRFFSTKLDGKNYLSSMKLIK